MTLETIQKFISSQQWIFAKTMPQNPHWYVCKDKLPSTEDKQIFELFVQYIRDNGIAELYQGKKYICWYHEGYKYWTMGAPLENTIIINRAYSTQAETSDNI
ncbi:hypothetical protein LJC56_11980 [Christensenellaceae bacterium OttesenSCG-928-K19]|nr:hypothetical protein [Christensenellaceae bacterium OttesenSCG-928-K19]